MTQQQAAGFKGQKKKSKRCNVDAGGREACVHRLVASTAKPQVVMMRSIMALDTGISAAASAVTIRLSDMNLEAGSTAPHHVSWRHVMCCQGWLAALALRHVDEHQGG